MSDPTGNSQDRLADQPVNDKRVDLYARIMEAQQRIARARYRHGVADDVVQTALDAVDERMSEDERREDLYLSALSYYVEALGGRLEVRAVFGDEAVVVRREPAS
jgi:hypothetical protein